MRHYLFPWDMVEREEEAGGQIALVFGEEGKGLSAEDLSACDYFVTLPTWEGYPIANLSHAVNVMRTSAMFSTMVHEPTAVNVTVSTQHPWILKNSERKTHDNDHTTIH